jgi:transcriptional regulator with XRE-family HTH domain
MSEALPELLAELGLSLRWLAEQLGIGPAHLSRGLRGVGGRFISGELALQIEAVLELPEGYFPETREALVVAAVRADDKLRDAVFRRLR